MKENNLVCRICGGGFYRIPSKMKRNKESFCSKKCFDKSRINRIQFDCQNCGVTFDRTPSYSTGKYIVCSKECLYRVWVGVNHSGFFKKGNTKEKCINFKDGKQKTNGYISILVPEHPKATKKGYVYEHRIIMEKHLGRYLTDSEVIHHINEKKTDNRIENLQLFQSTGEHTSYHLKNRKR